MAKGHPIIGVYDSGIGGLTVLDVLVEAFPEVSFVYVADQKHCPYGEKSLDFLSHRGAEMLQFLSQHHGVDAIVVACHTLSTTVFPNLLQQNMFCCPLVDVATPTLKALMDEPHVPILLLGTSATIGSGYYEKSLYDQGFQGTIISLPCPQWALCIEQGVQAVLEKEIQQTLSTLSHAQKAHIQKVVYVCTHYPLIAHTIQRHLPSVQHFNPAHVIPQQLSFLPNKKLGEKSGKEANECFHDHPGKGPRIQFFSTYIQNPQWVSLKAYPLKSLGSDLLFHPL